MNTYMGIDIGGTKIAYGLFDENRRLIQRKQVPADAGADGPAFFSDVARQIKELISDLTAMGDQLKGIGIGITGFVDFERGALTVTVSLPRLNNFCVVDYLRAELKTDIPLLMDNDCHCGALTEYRRGAGQGHRHMLYCPINTGTSTGIIIDGKLFRGSNGASGETGHTLSAVQGELRDVHACACGNSGCFNSLGSGKAITFHIRHWLEQGETSIMPELAGGGRKDQCQAHRRRLRDGRRAGHSRGGADGALPWDLGIQRVYDLQHRLPRVQRRPFEDGRQTLQAHPGKF